MKRLSLLLTICFLLITLVACDKEPTVALVESAPMLSELSAELKAEIEAAWQKQFGEELVCRTERGFEDVTIFYYGTYQGLPVFFRSPVIDAMVAGSLRVGNEVLEWGRPFQIYVYKDGALHMLATLYAQKILTDNDIKQIAAVQNYFWARKR